MIGALIGLARDDGALLALGATTTLVGAGVMASRRRGSQVAGTGTLERAVLISKLLDTVSSNKDRYRAILNRLDLEDLRAIQAELSLPSSRPPRSTR